MKYIVTVRLRKGVLDAEGNAALDALKSLGYEVESVSTAKVYSIDFDGPREKVEEMCKRLLANPIIQEYDVAMR